ncbi:hypothetical protein A7J57_22035 [Agrobacterium tumefaciens]|uniref:Uncharacterized protein n=1 Tax=Agrobacterium tumefaciens TaxID=358 RepID=A0A176XGI0_AGRTU|nr:hypothetical protein A7J57_22035 [Agrobacterium tumefaciens]
MLDRIDLIHGFNRIPLNPKPFVIGFESHLPRGFGIENSFFFTFMRNQLLNERCRAIVGISEYAKRTFLAQHEETSAYHELAAKLVVRMPSVVLPKDPPAKKQTLPPIRLLFVGNHFARKGGCVALRLAQLSLDAGVPLEIEIISKLEIGRVSWTDPLDESFFDRYRPLLNLPNVRCWGELPNQQVIEKIRQSHFLLLPTFGDSFGYSAIESLTNGTPVIATRQCALPEFIRDGVNGIMLDLPLNDKGEWIHLNSPDRGSKKFEKIHAQEVDRLTEETLRRLKEMLNSPTSFDAMAMNAHETAIQQFDSRLHDTFWDDLYETAVLQPVEAYAPECAHQHHPIDNFET